MRVPRTSSVCGSRPESGAARSSSSRARASRSLPWSCKAMLRPNVHCAITRADGRIAKADLKCPSELPGCPSAKKSSPIWTSSSGQRRRNLASSSRFSTSKIAPGQWLLGRPTEAIRRSQTSLQKGSIPFAKRVRSKNVHAFCSP